MRLLRPRGAVPRAAAGPGRALLALSRPAARTLLDDWIAPVIRALLTRADGPSRCPGEPHLVGGRRFGHLPWLLTFPTDPSSRDEAPVPDPRPRPARAGGGARAHAGRRRPRRHCAGPFRRPRARPRLRGARGAVAGEPRIRLVAKRVAGRWGSFGLVEAPLNALAQVEAEGVEPDYVMLLSGACLPCRPVASLERYLAENAAREFIESEDESWVADGWRGERWRYRIWFDHKTQRPPEWLSSRIQQSARRPTPLPRRARRRASARSGGRSPGRSARRSSPTSAAIRSGSTSSAPSGSPTRWCSRPMCTPWCRPRRSPASALTHFQFTNRGKPVVFHDDHADYVRSLDRFFVRKVSPEATALRAACLAQAAAPGRRPQASGRVGPPRRLPAQDRRPDPVPARRAALLPRPARRP